MSITHFCLLRLICLGPFEQRIPFCRTGNSCPCLFVSWTINFCKILHAHRVVLGLTFRGEPCARVLTHTHMHTHICPWSVSSEKQHENSTNCWNYFNAKLTNRAWNLEWNYLVWASELKSRFQMIFKSTAQLAEVWIGHQIGAPLISCNSRHFLCSQCSVAW